MRMLLVLLAATAGLLGFTLLRSSSSAEVDADVTAPLGEPIGGLSISEQSQFERGRTVFLRRFTPAQGLGPHFNAIACVSCHEDPAPGGSSERYRDFLLVGRSGPGGSVVKAYDDCTPETQGAEVCLPSLVLPHYGPKTTVDVRIEVDVEHVPVPPDADVIARRNAPPLFGVGLFQLVSDAEILEYADPDDSDQDGISGKANFISKEDGRLGRFGYKCQTSSIEAFNRGALQNQMGITSDSTRLVLGDGTPEDAAQRVVDRLFGVRTAFAQEATPEDRITDFDLVPDPEISRDDLLDLIVFQENLAAPSRGEITPGVRRGEDIFERLECTSCHRASLETTLGLIHPYTDLLVHDMGPALADGIAMELATGSEFRTQPLWGVSQHAPFLHDGRADRLEEAVSLHGGEAQTSRDGFESLGVADREDLLRFLESL